MSKIKICVGNQFNNWVVIKKAESRASQKYWLCKCKCGKEKEVAQKNLINGKSRQCKSCSLTTHNQTNTRLYKIWENMKTRTTCPSHKDYKNYGERGIVVSDEWQSFEPFLQWAISNGYKDNLTIDRIDVNKNYESKNCRWITNKDQQSNRRNNFKIEYNGVVKTLTQWSEEYGINLNTLRNRLCRSKWDIKKALNTPIKPR